MKPSIFLDWFGVIADNDIMTKRWRRVEAKILQNKYGGSVSKWMNIHDRAFNWYLRYWKQHGPRSRKRYRDIWKTGEIEWTRRTLEWSGVRPPRTREQLFRLDRELTYEITRQINPLYPQSRRVLEKLRQRSRLFLVSGADSGYIKGAIEATGLENLFESTYSPDTLDCFKGTPGYWNKILRLSGSDPTTSAVVDDRAKFLVVPARLGLRPVLVAPSRASNGFPHVRSIKQLLNSPLLSSLKSRTE